MTKNQAIAKNVATSSWLPCTDEDYPESRDVVIACYDKDNKNWAYWLRADCPYGWNVLCNMQAYWMPIKSPVAYDE